MDAPQETVDRSGLSVDEAKKESFHRKKTKADVPCLDCDTLRNLGLMASDNCCKCYPQCVEVRAMSGAAKFGTVNRTHAFKRWHVYAYSIVEDAESK